MLEGRIHWYDYQDESDSHKDENGEPKSGWYWNIIEKENDGTETDLSGQYGPYGSRPEAEAACTAASISGDY